MLKPKTVKEIKHCLQIKPNGNVRKTTILNAFPILLFIQLFWRSWKALLISFLANLSNSREQGRRDDLLPRSLSMGWCFHASGIISLRAFRTNWLLINLQMLKMLKVTWGWMMEKYASNRIFWFWSPGTYFWIFTPACLTLSYTQRTDTLIRLRKGKKPAP